MKKDPVYKHDYFLIKVIVHPKMKIVIRFTLKLLHTCYFLFC